MRSTTDVDKAFPDISLISVTSMCVIALMEGNRMSLVPCKSVRTTLSSFRFLDKLIISGESTQAMVTFFKRGMEKSAQASLTYLSREFGNYPHSQIRLWKKVPAWSRRVGLKYLSGYTLQAWLPPLTKSILTLINLT